jgi:hypothetical protein
MLSQVEDIQMALTRYSSLDTGHSEIEVQVWKQSQHATPRGLVARLLEIKIYCQQGINGRNTPPHKHKIWISCLRQPNVEGERAASAINCFIREEYDAGPGTGNRLP